MPTTVLRPDADVNASGWTNDEGGSSLWDHLQDGTHSAVASRRVNWLDMQRGRGIEIVWDDAKADDGTVVLQSTPGTLFASRDGERVGETSLTEIRDKGVNCLAARNEYSQCATSRASIETGLHWVNHGVKDTLAHAYYPYARVGQLDARVYGVGNRWKGTYEFDLALKLGLELLAANPADPTGLALLAQTPVDAADQRVVGILTGGVIRSGYDSDMGCYPVQTHTGCGTTSGSRIVTDTSVRAGDKGKLVSGSGIPANTYVGTVTAGSQFLLSSSPNSQVNVLATATATVDLTVGGVGRGDTTDDVQQCGCRTTWLRPDGTVAHLDHQAAFGKRQNCTGSTAGTTPFNVADGTGSILYALTTRFVPAGLTAMCCYIDDLQNHDDSHVVEYWGGKGTNYGSGDGAVGDNYDYQYRYPITAISWAAGVCTVTATNPNTIYAADVDPLVRVGDEVGIDLVGTATGYNTNAVAVDSIVSQTATSVTFTVAMASDPTAGGTVTPTNLDGTGSGACVGLWKMFDSILMAQRIINYLETIADDETFFIQWGIREPHGSFNGALPAEDYQAPMRYELHGFVNNAVDPDDYENWNDVPGAISPAASGVTTGRKQDWARRQHMFAAADDAIKMVLSYMIGRWGPQGFWVVMPTDNGFLTGDHFDTESNAWSMLNGKSTVWDGCLRVFLWLRHPDYAPQTLLTPVMVADQARTVLDLYAKVDALAGWAEHHAHTKRDGRSIVRMLAGGDPDDGRYMWGSGQYFSSSDPADGQWIVDPTGRWKLIRSYTAANPTKLFDMTPDPSSPVGWSVDHETVDVSAANPSVVTTLTDALDAIQDLGWNPTTGVNDMRAFR